MQCVVIIIGGTSIPGINIMTGMMAVMVTHDGGHAAAADDHHDAARDLTIARRWLYD